VIQTPTDPEVSEIIEKINEESRHGGNLNISMRKHHHSVGKALHKLGETLTLKRNTAAPSTLDYDTSAHSNPSVRGGGAGEIAPASPRETDEQWGAWLRLCVPPSLLICPGLKSRGNGFWGCSTPRRCCRVVAAVLVVDGLLLWWISWYGCCCCCCAVVDALLLLMLLVVVVLLVLVLLLLLLRMWLWMWMLFLLLLLSSSSPSCALTPSCVFPCSDKQGADQVKVAGASPVRAPAPLSKTFSRDFRN
jgi:hypothetical protein